MHDIGVKFDDGGAGVGPDAQDEKKDGIDDHGVGVGMVDRDQSDQSDAGAMKEMNGEGLVHEEIEMGIRMITRGLGSMQLKRKINEIKTTEVGIFKNMHIDRVDQSDQSGTSQVQSLIKNYERLRMKESEPGHLHIPKLRNVYKFGNNTEITYESPSK